jgi:hypothetical protein
MFLDLVRHNEMRMRRTVPSSVACPPLQYLFTFSHKRYFLRKQTIEHQMCVLLIFSTSFSEIYIIARRTERDTIKNVNTSSRKVPVTLVRF